MLSKAQNKYIRSLTQQKFRNEYKIFIAEGTKIAQEWLSNDGYIQMIITTAAWAEQHHELIAKHAEAELQIVKESELASLSHLQTPNQVILLVPIPTEKEIPVSNEWYFALDNIQDPGNMGTIIRVADWFGVRHVVCAPGCADIYSPKVVQSAVGGHLRVHNYEADLILFLESIALPKFAATLDGDNIYDMHRYEAGVLIIGNESKGISEQVMNIATQKVTIPRKGGAESLNAGVATGILCAMLLPC